ncbi:PREDICTED: protein O-mannosyl-transferase 2-like [Priapulus caudatus]|uniref:Protein O-mannosyl-transferase 2 n=1 Tax=Priapulus caudatus TaxID=37621 RepID=A0ABM1DSQ0_PRICU|nr:PREDICTED: protein O-mannosyl-transferase 2-like [Priapulus caudatus]XP_014662972.1 PREDICTED: protein O-mannosyl-transferase 2-like [Priapulus caudatus]
MTKLHNTGGTKPADNTKPAENAKLADSTKQHPQNASWWCMAFISITAIGFATRFYRLDEPKHICWDETHFGKFASWYINRTFFFDVHPPLGKMLIALAGVASGYNGSFAFETPGNEYGDTPYIGMRAICCVFGSALVPLTFLIVWEKTLSLSAASIASLFITFDTASVTISRYILLDPLLMCFILLPVYCWVKFLSYGEKAYTAPWWFWLTSTGASLACSVGVKFVGLFVVIFIGISTVADLWDILGDLRKPLSNVARHFLARALCLICVPLAIYIAFFGIHFHILKKSGQNTEGYFSSAFQSQLEGNPLNNASMPEYVAYGAILTVKNYRVGGLYLHSHWSLYPKGVGLPHGQITSYFFKDDNNKWVIKEVEGETPEVHNVSTPIKLVRSGDLVRLEHYVTRRNLHSHSVPAPITMRHFQVTGYGVNGTGDANDIWRVEVDGQKHGVPVRTVVSNLRFIHVNSKCALHSHSKQYPKWGFEQLEVTCNPVIKDKNTLWNVEDNYFPRLPNVSVEVYAPSFFEKLVESHAVMHQGNAGLKPKEHEVVQSRPWMWPLNLKGQHFSGMEPRIFLLGNPVIWWINCMVLLIFPVMYAVARVREERNVEERIEITELKHRTFSAAWWLYLGWALNYLPFWPMTRVLYFHHYLPAAMFNCMLAGVVLDFILQVLQASFANRLSSKSPQGSSAIHHFGLGVLLAVLAYSFYLFMPLCYGMEGPKSNDKSSRMHGLKWLESWDI